MKLCHITFTGIDVNTNIQDLEDIQRKYPLAEFGVLYSYHWYENGNRYLNPALLNNLRGSGLNLSMHLCGSAAHDAAIGDWAKIHEHTFLNADMFKRFQLNVSNRKDNPEVCHLPMIYGQEVIIQQKDVNHLDLYKNTINNWNWDPHHKRAFSVLLDASGGQGIDTPVEILNTHHKVGYAGGINPDNVEDKLSYILHHEQPGEFWIDMESGVRTNDWFDIDKVVKVLETCDRVLKYS